MAYLDSPHYDRLPQPPPGPEHQPGKQPHWPTTMQLTDMWREQEPVTGAIAVPLLLLLLNYTCTGC